jgi:hypothetical protein
MDITVSSHITRHIRHGTILYFPAAWLELFPVTNFIATPELHAMTAKRYNIPVLRKQGRNVQITCYHTAPHGTNDEVVAVEHGDSLTNRSFAH